MQQIESEASAKLRRRDPRYARAVRSIACISRVFEQVGRNTGVSLPQYRLMLYLRHGPKRAGELAGDCAIKRPTLTAMVAGLEKEGRLQRVADESDGRGVRIALTPLGREALDRIEGRLAKVIDQMFSQGDRELMLTAFDDLSEIVECEVDRKAADGTLPGPGSDQEA